MNPTMSAREWLLLVTLSVVWGGSFFFIEVALRELPPLTVVLGRVGIAALALNAWVFARNGRMPGSLGVWGAFLVMGALNGLVPYTLIVWGQQNIDSGLASILNGTTPLFSVVLAHFLTRQERMTGSRVAGVVLGLAGVTVLVGPGALSGLGPGGLGQFAVLAAALSYALAGIYGRRFKDMPPMVAAAGQVTGTVLLVLPLALVVDHPWTLDPGTATWGAVLGLALLSTAAGYVIFFRILATAGATNVMLVTLLMPVSALVLGAVVLGERPGALVFVGMGLIFIGIAAIDGRVLSRARRMAFTVS
jgi:drug/metabolite transporter (DMT)-like permease